MEKPNFETPDISQKGSVEPPEDRPCAHEGCTGHGAYPAPRSRDDLRDYIWLCLEHVRAYNRQWNYFDGCDEKEMEEAVRRSTTWERPSWRFGTAGRGGRSWQAAFSDPFDLFGQSDHGSGRPAPEARPEEKRAWGVFGLSPCACAETVKKRYKELAKRHHPDANGGSKQSEDRLKTINWAYGVLKAQF